MIYIHAIPTSIHQLTVSPYTNATLPLGSGTPIFALALASHSHSHSHCRRYGAGPTCPPYPRCRPWPQVYPPARSPTSNPIPVLRCTIQDATTAATTAVEVTTIAGTTAAGTRRSASKGRGIVQRKRWLQAPQRRKKDWKRRARWRVRTKAPFGSRPDPPQAGSYFITRGTAKHRAECLRSCVAI